MVVLKVQCLNLFNSSSLTGEHHTRIHIRLLSFVLQYFFEDISIFHTFFFFTRKGKHVHWLWAIESWCNFMARRLLLPLRMLVQVLNWLTLLWNNYAFHSGTFYHAILLLCRLHVLRRYKREEQRLLFLYMHLTIIYTHTSNSTFKCKIMWEFTLQTYLICTLNTGILSCIKETQASLGRNTASMGKIYC